MAGAVPELLSFVVGRVKEDLLGGSGPELVSPFWMLGLGSGAWGKLKGWAVDKLVWPDSLDCCG